MKIILTTAAIAIAMSGTSYAGQGFFLPVAGEQLRARTEAHDQIRNRYQERENLRTETRLGEEQGKIFQRSRGGLEFLTGDVGGFGGNAGAGSIGSFGGQGYGKR